MIIREESSLARKVIIVDKSTLTEILNVRWYDTETKEAEIYVMLNQRPFPDNEVFKVLKEKIKFDYETLTGVDYEEPVYNCKAIAALYDKNRNGGVIIPRSRTDQSMNSKNELVTAIITLRNSVAINRETGEEIK